MIIADYCIVKKQSKKFIKILSIIRINPIYVKKIITNFNHNREKLEEIKTYFFLLKKDATKVQRNKYIAMCRNADKKLC